MLLAPAASRSLASIGSIYGKGYEKVIIPKEAYKDMLAFSKSDKKLFEEYALRDAIITLKHVNELEDFCLKYVNLMGVPLTLSSIGKLFVMKTWDEEKYSYQYTSEHPLGNPSKVFTPKGLSSSPISVFLSLFIANYKGGRNESFMYGIDNETTWYDYDLASAYTTSMACLGDPDYSKHRVLTSKDVKGLTPNDVFSSYIAVEAYFTFPESVKYPSIPCYVDKTTTVYPIKGRAFLTGFELLLAMQQGCTFNVIQGVLIPFRVKGGLVVETVSDMEKEKEKPQDKEEKTCPLSGFIDINFSKLREEFTQQPFFNIMKNVQSQRKKYPKGSLPNLM